MWRKKRCKPLARASVWGYPLQSSVLYFLGLTHLVKSNWLFLDVSCVSISLHLICVLHLYLLHLTCEMLDEESEDWLVIVPHAVLPNRFGTLVHAPHGVSINSSLLVSRSTSNISVELWKLTSYGVDTWHASIHRLATRSGGDALSPLFFASEATAKHTPASRAGISYIACAQRLTQYTHTHSGSSLRDSRRLQIPHNNNKKKFGNTEWWLQMCNRLAKLRINLT